ncbi:MAG: hypothetical protein R3B06_14950 [Kofleriaceae bacterium]
MTTSVDQDDLLLARVMAGVPPESPAEAAARAPYERLVARLRPTGTARPGWQARVHARLQVERDRERGRRRWLIGGGLALAAAAAAAVVLSWPHRPAPRSGVAMTVFTTAGAPRRGSGAVGDTLHVEVPQTARFTELRVYRNGELVRRCPGDDGCEERAGALALTLRITALGRYRTLALSSADPVPPPARLGAGGLDADTLAARSAGARVDQGDVVLVQP